MSKSLSLPIPTSTLTRHSFQPSVLPEALEICSDIMRECVFKNVDYHIYTQKTKQSDINYDLNLAHIQASSVLEVPLVTAALPVSNLVVLGDRMGTISLYDVNKKMVLSKKDVSPGHRIIGISAQAASLGKMCITTVAIIAHGDPNVYVYRYRQNETKLFLNAVIGVSTVAQQTGQKIGDYPYQVKLGKYGLVAVVVMYNGSVVLYQIPEPKTSKNPELQLGNQPKITTGAAHQAVFSPLDQTCEKISKAEVVLQFPGQERKKTYKQMIASMIKPVLETPPPETVKDQKKVPKGKEDKKDSKAVVAIEQKKEQKCPLMDINQQSTYPIRIVQEGKDYTPPISHPKFRPIVNLINETIFVPGVKQYSQGKTACIPIKLIVIWTNTTKYRVYQIQQASPHNLPAYLHLALFDKQRPTGKDALKLSLLQETRTIYPVSSVSTSQDMSLIALGLTDGTVQLWDALTNTFKHNFDKHTGQVTVLAFFQVYKLVSGASDGSVMIHDLQKVETVARRTNIFQSQDPYCVLLISISDAGIAYVLDSLCNLKVYDLWRNQKVGVFDASPPEKLTNKYRKWNVETPIVLIVSQQVMVLSDNMNENQIEGKRSMNIQTFKVFETLLSLFNALSVVYRKGIDRQKVLNIFSNLSTSQLSQKSFEIPDDSQHTLSVLKNPINQGLQTINEGVSKNPPGHPKKQKGKSVLFRETLEPQLMMFSRKRTPKSNQPSQQWLVSSIREEHSMKNARQGKILNLTMKTDNSFHP